MFDEGLAGIHVTLLSALDPIEAAHTVMAFAEATFDDIPPLWDGPQASAEGYSDDASWEIAQRAVAGQAVVPTALESVALTFAVEGVSRTCTHQLVRTRVGAGFGQHSMRATPASGFNVRLPASFEGLPAGALDAYRKSIPHLRRLYQTMLDAGVPYQDARFVLPMGTTTHLVGVYNLLAIAGLLRRRLCNRMQWEINYVSRLMHDEIVRALPWVGRSLRTRCEVSGVCQTLDPMFEASCLHYVGNGEAEWCEDSPYLEDAQFNWTRDRNGSVTHFALADANRLIAEGENKDIVVSMVDGHTVLARRDDRGLWRKS